MGAKKGNGSSAPPHRRRLKPADARVPRPAGIGQEQCLTPMVKMLTHRAVAPSQIVDTKPRTWQKFRTGTEGRFLSTVDISTGLSPLESFTFPPTTSS